MGHPIKLYVYDLSNGLARQLSMQLTGKQIDGIWHTSVVAFGKEVFYGQGICTTNPGHSHHGQPLQIVDMGETDIDESTFDDYIQEMNSVYTADKYHLLDFNCNSFTDDCIGFLTGGSIPSWIKNLPADFLSTPFGAALRPTIDNMFRRPTSGAVSPQPHNQPMASSLLQSVASRAAGPSATPASYLPTPAATPQPAAATVSAPLQICSNLHHFRGLLASHRAVCAFFTSRTCPPCKIVEPVFEDLASQKASNGVAFVKVDLSAMLGGEVAGAYGVRATPTFLFFLNGQKIHELKGANVPELRSQVDLLIFQAYPPHPHAVKAFSSIRSISLDPILFNQVPALDTIQAKLVSFIGGIPPTTYGDTEKQRAKRVLSGSTIPFLKTRLDPKLKMAVPSAAATKKVCEDWTTVSVGLIKVLPQAQLFPLIDLWRIGLLDNSISSWCASASLSNPTGRAAPVNPVLRFLVNASSDISSLPKPVILTTLRMLSNAFANVALSRTLLSPAASGSSASPRQDLTSVLVTTLLHDDSAVRTAAASLAFNIAAFLQKPRLEVAKSGRRGDDISGSDEGEEDWEVELVSAIVEALRTETASEDVVHRLTASLAFLLHLSPFYEAQLKSLLEVLQVKEVLKAKLNGGPEGCGEKGVSKKDVRSLINEVVNELC